MINGLYLSTMGALVQSERNATIANNMANANTDGFKPDWVRVRSLPSESNWPPDRRLNHDEILRHTGGGAWLEPTRTNLRAGPFAHTGNPFDLALQDDPESGATSFFMVQPAGGDAGTVFYTRAGHFIPCDDGVLRDPSGNTLLTPDGAPVQVSDAPEGAQIHITEDGTVTAHANGANVVLGQIGVRRTADAAEMKKVGHTLFDPQNAAMEPYQGGVQQNTLEKSATSAINEMVNMIEAQRLYDFNMKFVSIQDETLGQTVRRVSATA